MKSALRKTIENPVASFTMQELVSPHFDPNWHFHPHYQLFTVEEGTGTRFIGDNIQPFEPGDTVFLGPNIPHLWRSDPPYFQTHSELQTKGIVVYFTEDFLGTDFFQRPEMHVLQSFFQHAVRGVEIKGRLREQIRESMKQLLRATGFQAILHLLTLLDELAHSEECQAIASLGYVNTHKVSETERMQKVHDYVLDHFQQEIRLDEMASLAGMSASAFCRYFKTRTNRTFSEFVSEVRIGYACKLLMEGKLTITQICYESGFNTISNFNRQFKDLTSLTPAQYQKAYR
ncbi:AraC family transcriptional regulator [Siphonobacter sp. BAB-5385]|uniref:helix-turn-helix domain-containing protein n=1 Tax=unclassified Siphonobacter TaxID=2635712 RepID=UPI000B9E3804|nr:MULTISPECIES: AraC family transcriptional regulator [unclassified Siphonobacter]OZI06173.1 AraC family transcriptional regulator [Siphonobacter sp. BAB-5385]PMD94347.1 AraC family transcriptional regulator [Siphonobacter sp. BAB-5405]